MAKISKMHALTGTKMLSLSSLHALLSIFFFFFVSPPSYERVRIRTGTAIQWDQS